MSDPPAWYRARASWTDGHVPEPPEAAAPPDDGEVNSEDAVCADAPSHVDHAGTDDTSVARPSNSLFESTSDADPTTDTAPAAVMTEPVADPVAALSESVAAPSDDQEWQLRSAVVVAVLVATISILVLTVEVVGRNVLQHLITDHIREAGVAQDVDVTVGRSWWTPSISRMLLTGTLDTVEMDLRSTSLIGLPTDAIRYRLDDLGVSASFIERRVSIISIGNGRVEATLDADAFGESLGMSAVVRDGQLYLGEFEDPARMDIRGSEVVITHPALLGATGSEEIVLPASDPYLLPCDLGLSRRSSELTLACMGSNVPGILAGPFLGSSGPGGDGSDGDSGAEVDIYAPGPLHSPDIEDPGVETRDDDPADPAETGN